MRKLALVVLAACGGGGGRAPDAGPYFDADPAAPDAGPSCGTTWELRDAPAMSLTVFDPEPAVAGRTVRVGVVMELGGCDELAMITVGYTLENEGIAITPRVWHAVGPDCQAGRETIVRPVVLSDLYAGTWQIYALGATDGITLPVAAAPSCSAGRTPCQLDCDCDEDAGERCLGYSGFAGPSTMCAVPCEADRDCAGTTCEGDISDGLGYVCSTTPECDGARPCDPGWTCDAGACTPDFTLDQGSRHTCACDADCEPGLRCATPYDPTAPRRCEALCETPGAWCQGAHVCGWVGQDASGLAGVDSVCVWLGE